MISYCKRGGSTLEHFPECGKPIDLNVGAGLSLDEVKVPDHLAHLIPLVNKWSFVNLHDQDIFVALMKKNRPDEVQALNKAFHCEVRNEIREWAASLPFDKHVKEFSEEDWAHPYWSFLNVIKLLECTGGHGDSPGREAARNSLRQEMRRNDYAKAILQADDAFRTGKFADYTKTLAPFEDLLTETQRKKMLLAKKRAASSELQ
jgi:hypothetical protein